MMWMVLLVLMVSGAEAACVRHAPFVQIEERMQLVEPGEIAETAVVIRNDDSCECSAMRFALQSGWHPPNGDPYPSFSVPIESTRLVKDGQPINAVELEPGEAVDVTLRITVTDHVPDGPGYITPVVIATRQGLPCIVAGSGGIPLWGPGCFENEDTALCLGMDEATCRPFIYPSGPRS